MAKPNKFFLKYSDHEEGPFSEEEVAQLFADGKVNRDTPCKLAGGNDWKTIDDFMPMLKYGTQLPSPSSPASPAGAPRPSGYGAPAKANRPPPVPADSRVRVVDVDIPFGSVFTLVLKVMIAATIIGIGLGLLYLMIMVLFLGGLLSHFRP
jgi:hypothetical protein